MNLGVSPALWIRAYRAIALSGRLGGRDERALSLREIALLARGLALRPWEQRLCERHGDPGRPVVFIVGAPRSGTTLLYQLVARCFDVGYVSNEVARYWLAPVLAWRRALRRAPLEREQILLSSRYGATSGSESPHEFGWFFRTWMELDRSDELSAAELSRCAWGEVRAELEGIAGLFRSALVIKNLNAVSFNVEAFARELSQSRFLHVTRDREATIASVLTARRAMLGDDARWWSIRPAGYREWAALAPREQVRQQVDATREAISRAFGRLSSERYLTVRLDELRANPRGVLESLAPVLDSELRLDRLPNGAGLEPAATGG